MRRFTDRRDAGRQLAASLARFGAAKPAVFALPRGGVPVAYEVARALGAPLDLVLVRKIGAPGQPELGVGAIAEGNIVAMDEGLATWAGAPGQVALTVQRELAELARREQCYAPARRPIPVDGRLCIIVDDGVATGVTARAALRALRGRGAATVVLAVPVAAPASLVALRTEADEIVCLYAPAAMVAVGQCYQAFGQTDDAEVIELLRASRSYSEELPPAAQPDDKRL